MEYRDFSEYQYEVPRPLTTVRNVGWIDDHEFTRGKVSQEFVRRLTWAAAREQVNSLRCTRPCPVCGTDGIDFTYDGIQLFIGSAEVWIPDYRSELIYASPDLILHYITEHDYSPPADFVSSVLAFDIHSVWSGEATRERLVQELYQ